MSGSTGQATGIAPVAIGGVGGSGTRLVAAIVREKGVHLGDDLNVANDNLWFTLLFKRREILHCTDAEFDRLVDALVSALAGGRHGGPGIEALVRDLAVQDHPRHPATWLQQRCATLLAALGKPAHCGHWGWKEPNTHIVIERLWQRLPTLRYVHVVRHGLDMALSANQSQLALWGPHVLGDDGPATPARSLAYWCAVHRRMQGLLAANPHRMHWLDFDALCRDPAPVVDELCAFLGLDSATDAPTLATIHQPAPRHATQPILGIAQHDLDYVRSLGYGIA